MLDDSIDFFEYIKSHPHISHDSINILLDDLFDSYPRMMGWDYPATIILFDKRDMLDGINKVYNSGKLTLEQKIPLENACKAMKKYYLCFFFVKH